MALDKRLVYVTGLPRAGSTLLCQLLGHHPDIYSTGHSSPLAHAIDSTRHSLSNDDFLLSQFDVNFDLVYSRLRNAYRGFMNGWTAEAPCDTVVDKNRAWLGMIETVADLDPNFKMLVCIRELGQIWGSIEQQHRNTVLLDTGDRTAGLTPQGRGARRFNEGGMVASPLGSISAALREVPVHLRERLVYIKYEKFVQNPAQTMLDIFNWLDLTPHEIDPDNLRVKASENDSYYRYKFPHHTYTRIDSNPRVHWVPEPISKGLKNQYRWYYEYFYPDFLA